MKIPLPFKQLRQQQLHAWINHNTDFKCDSLELVSGDAGFRRYYRFVYREQSIIAVDAPPESENVSQFIAVAHTYRDKGIKVPEVLMNGNHRHIEDWRERQSLGRTWQRRPDLLKLIVLDDRQQALLNDFKDEFS